LQTLMKRTLMREGILESSKFQQFMQQAEEEEFEDFDDTDWSFDVIPDEGRVDIDMNVDFKVDEIKGLEDIFYTDQAIKDIGMSRSFGAILKKMIFDQVPGFVYEESMYPDLSRRYVSTHTYGRNEGEGHARLGISFTVTSDHPDGVIPSAMSMIEHVKKEDVEEIAKQAYTAIIRQGTSPIVSGYSDGAKQQNLPFGDKESESEPESEKALNERIHRNWSSFLGKSIV